MKRVLLLIGAVLLSLIGYLAFWPVAISPQSWDAPPNPGYTGAFAPNTALSALTFTALPAGEYGPEDIAAGPDGALYTAVHSGKILRQSPQTGDFSVVADTGGRPLGLEFADDGTLWIADAYLGLLSVSPEGELVTRATETRDGSPILYADDVDIAADGRVYFSDASTRFGAKSANGTLAASVLDLMEHSSTGRILVYDPASGMTDVFADGLTFANGIAIIGDNLFVAETGAYAIHRYSLSAGATSRETILGPLPGFPDNINDAPDGTLWLGLVSPRSAPVDGLSDKPFLRKVIMRLPAFLHPAPTRYGFVLRLDTDGNVLETLQDPTGAYASTTGAIPLPGGSLAISSLVEPRIGVLTREAN